MRLRPDLCVSRPHPALFLVLLLAVPGGLAAQQARLPLDGSIDFANLANECARAIPLPEPTGHHQVGTVTYHWVDRSRPEKLTPEPHDDRQVIVTLFYPALRVPDGPPAPYFPGLDLFRAGFATDRRDVPQRIAEDLAVRDCVLTHAFANRPIDHLEERYPVVLVSPGGNVSRHSHTALAQELASQGWIVAVMSHAYSGWDVFPEGGHVMSSDYWESPEGASAAERAQLDDEQASLLAGDAVFALDQLSDLARYDPGGRFTGRLDTARVAIIGHSRGGSTAARTCSTDERFDACVTFDNIGPDREAESGLPRPQLTIRRPWSEERETRLQGFLVRKTAVAVDAVIDGAVHMSFTDLPLIEPERHETEIAPERAHDIASALTLAFLDQHVLGREPVGLPEFPDVTLRAFGPGAAQTDADTGRAQSNAAVSPPAGHVQRTTPAAAGPSARVEAAHALADSLGTAAYMLVVDGELVDAYGDLSREYRLHSIRKSLLGTLYGVAVAKGTIDTTLTIGALGIDDYAGLTIAERSATLAHLLSSRSGVYLPATHENTGWDDVRPGRGSRAPGEGWFYSNWDFNAAGSAYQILTGENLFQAFQRDIAGPIGMVDFEGSDGAWRYGPRSWHPAYVFRMSTRDLARFGILLANEGMWNGRRVVPAEWVRKITRPRSDAVRPDGSPMPGVGYGMTWWTRDEASTREIYGDVGENVFVASGTGSQILVVAPQRKLVFVHRTDTDLPDERYRNVSIPEAGSILKLLLDQTSAARASSR